MVRIYDDVLPAHVLESVRQDIISKQQQNIWTSSAMRWSKDILVNIAGAQLNCVVDEAYSQYILSYVSDLLPKYGDETKVELQYCIFPPNAGISLHTDQWHNFAATIYLNEEWHINDGGLLIYEENQRWVAHVPKYNTMALVTDDTEHMVTPVSAYVKYPRYTIQIWGLKQTK